MKKIFTLLALMVLSMTAWAANETFEIKFKNKTSIEESPTTGYFTYDKGEGIAVSWSSKGKHSCTYGGEEYSDVIKMEGPTQCYFTSTAEATVTIVQTTSNAAGYKLKFDGTVIDGDMSNTTVTENGDNHYNEYVITKVAPGKHTITRVSETGLAYVKVEYTGEVKTTLATPEITFNATTGEVTIGAVANATEVRYTTDGSTPDEMTGDVYSNPFTVADGTVVKAIAIGTGSYMNSDVASEQVLIEGTVPVAPTIVSQAGAVSITCATPAVTIEYSTNGVDFTPYTYAFYLYEDATVSARAKRGDKTSEVAQFAFKAVAQPNDVETVVIQIPDAIDANSFEVDGCELTITGNAGKNYTVGGNKIVIDGVDHNAAKLSNGAQNTLKLPEGKKAVRLTLYSYVNVASNGARTSGWSEVNGVSYDVKEAPMGAFTDVAVSDGSVADPDVRSYLIDGKNEVTFTNTGEQLCFMVVVDIATDKTIIPTAISEVKAADAAADAPAYNLAGQKVDAAFKGIVIKNGKKVLNK